MLLRPALSLLFAPSLYWALLALSTQAVLAQETTPEAARAEPHIAVILPLQSASFGKHADSVRLGILAAAGADGDLGAKVRIYATTEDPQQVLYAYQRATSLGARAVIGPLTRNGVTTLAYSGVVEVPTLALNAPEGDIILPRNLYVFGLQLEAEARQVAQLAIEGKGRRAFVIAGDSPLDGRVAQAFSDEWQRLKGETVGHFTYTTEAAGLGKLREELPAAKADLAFMTLGAARARFVRSYVGSSLPIYATSQVLVSNTDTLGNYDLEGVRFLDMPWLLLPDHPAVLSYLRSDGLRASLDQERFYALGIDAYRIVSDLVRSRRITDPLDGVTGTITLGEGQQFQRALVPAQFQQGVARAQGNTGQ